MITMEIGNVLQADIMMHGVNCNPSKFDAGLAAYVWERYPKCLNNLRTLNTQEKPFDNLGEYLVPSYYLERKLLMLIPNTREGQTFILVPLR